MIFDTSAKVFNKKGQSFQQRVLGQLYSHVLRTPLLTPCTDLNPQWVIYLNTRATTVKPTRKHTSKSLWPWTKQWFLIYSTKCASNKDKNKLDFFKMNFYVLKNTIKKVKKPTEWENVFENYGNVLVSRVYSEHLW